jgi:excisionase family DNA binding protein
MPNTKQYLPLEQVARRLNLQIEIVKELLDSRTIPGLKLGGAWLIPEPELEQFLDAEFAKQNPGGITSSMQPVPSKERPASARQRRRSPAHAVRVLFRGREVEMPSYSGAAVWIVEELAAEDAAFMTRLGAVRRGKRRYVAANRDDLYVNRPDLPARQMSNGWWIGTNYSRLELERMLRKACEISGLQFGSDVVIKESGPPVATERGQATAFVGSGHSGLGDLARRHDDYLTED